MGGNYNNIRYHFDNRRKKNVLIFLGCIMGKALYRPDLAHPRLHWGHGRLTHHHEVSLPTVMVWGGVSLGGEEFHWVGWGPGELQGHQARSSNRVAEDQSDLELQCEISHMSAIWSQYEDNCWHILMTTHVGSKFKALCLHMLCG